MQAVAQGAERVPELVRERRQELALEPIGRDRLGPAALADVYEHVDRSLDFAVLVVDRVDERERHAPAAVRSLDDDLVAPMSIGGVLAEGERRPAARVLDRSAVDREEPGRAAEAI